MRKRVSRLGFCPHCHESLDRTVRPNRGLRFLARLIDILAVTLCLKITHWTFGGENSFDYGSFFFAYALYGFIGAFFSQGGGLGKYICRLKPCFVTENNFKNRFLREFYFLLLFPFIALPFFFGKKRFLHERLTDSHLEFTP